MNNIFSLITKSNILFSRICSVAVILAACTVVKASPQLISVGTFSDTTDKSGLTDTLENGASDNMLGGIGSGLAWAGGNTFLMLPDRGPNATTWNANLDNTTSYISRFQTVSLQLSANNSGTGLAFNLSTTLNDTKLLYSTTALNYGASSPGYNPAQPTSSSNYAAGAPAINNLNQFYFTGRSDGFGAGPSSNPNNARLDPEGIRVSNDGTKVYISDEYGPYVYEFDRSSGARTKTFNLPSEFAVANLSPVGSTEISGNTSGRVANKGMEGLAITPDGKTLVGFIQSPLIQDGGDGGRMNRLVTIDIATGATKQYAYDNFLADKAKNYNSSEILAVNDHVFFVLERDGKGLGDGSPAVVKRIYKVDITGAQDVTGLSGESTLLAKAVSKTLFLDLKTVMNSAGITDTNIPAKLEGMAFGDDVMDQGVLKHTLYVGNDNDFVPGVAGPNNVYVFGFTDADLGGATLVKQAFTVPDHAVTAKLLGLGFIIMITIFAIFWRKTTLRKT